MRRLIELVTLSSVLAFRGLRVHLAPPSEPELARLIAG